MRSKNQNNGNKEEKRLYYCSLCPFVAKTYEELDLHYSLSHDESDDDISYELEMAWENIKKKKKPRTLKEKAIAELMLLIQGQDYKNEYVGWCHIPYHLYTKRVGNKTIIKVVPGVEIC